MQLSKQVCLRTANLYIAGLFLWALVKTPLDGEELAVYVRQTCFQGQFSCARKYELNATKEY
jgi:hypothetical protein